jgi:CubicO group peptidase (beta-lactamase class C family)
MAVLAALAVVATGIAFSTYGDGYLPRLASTIIQRGSVASTPYDHKYFPTSKIAASPQAQPLPTRAVPELAALSPAVAQALQDSSALGYVVLHRGAVVHESYYQGHGPAGLTNSFSMAKAVVTLLVGAAIADGRIRSLEQPVSDFLPAYKEGPGARLRLVDVLSMKSGMSWDDPEVYNQVFAKTTRLYFGRDVKGFVSEQPIVEEPGQRFHYNSANTVIAAMVIEKATGKRLSEYLSEKLWIPLGMEQDAQWMLDREGGAELSFCCIAASARDYARLGQLVLQKGQWQGRQLVPADFIETALTPVAPNYGYTFRMDYAHSPKISLFRGIRGQLIIMVPEHDLVIVKVGNGTLPADPARPLRSAPETYIFVDETVRALGAAKG